MVSDMATKDKGQPPPWLRRKKGAGSVSAANSASANEVDEGRTQDKPTANACAEGGGTAPPAEVPVAPALRVATSLAAFVQSYFESTQDAANGKASGAVPIAKARGGEGELPDERFEKLETAAHLEAFINALNLQKNMLSKLYGVPVDTDDSKEASEKAGVGPLVAAVEEFVKEPIALPATRQAVVAFLKGKMPKQDGGAKAAAAASEKLVRLVDLAFVQTPLHTRLLPVYAVLSGVAGGLAQVELLGDAENQRAEADRMRRQILSGKHYWYQTAPCQSKELREHLLARLDGMIGSAPVQSTRVCVTIQRTRGPSGAYIKLTYGPQMGWAHPAGGGNTLWLSRTCLYSNSNPLPDLVLKLKSERAGVLKKVVGEKTITSQELAAARNFSGWVPLTGHGKKEGAELFLEYTYARLPAGCPEDGGGDAAPPAPEQPTGATDPHAVYAGMLRFLLVSQLHAATTLQSSSPLVLPRDVAAVLEKYANTYLILPHTQSLCYAFTILSLSNHHQGTLDLLCMHLRKSLQANKANPELFVQGDTELLERIFNRIWGKDGNAFGMEVLMDCFGTKSGGKISPAGAVTSVLELSRMHDEWRGKSSKPAGNGVGTEGAEALILAALHRVLERDIILLPFKGATVTKEDLKGATIQGLVDMADVLKALQGRISALYDESDSPAFLKCAGVVSKTMAAIMEALEPKLNPLHMQKVQIMPLVMAFFEINEMLHSIDASMKIPLAKESKLMNSTVDAVGWQLEGWLGNIVKTTEKPSQQTELSASQDGDEDKLGFLTDVVDFFTSIHETLPCLLACASKMKAYGEPTEKISKFVEWVVGMYMSTIGKYVVWSDQALGERDMSNERFIRQLNSHSCAIAHWEELEGVLLEFDRANSWSVAGEAMQRLSFKQAVRDLLLAKLEANLTAAATREEYRAAIQKMFFIDKEGDNELNSLMSKVGLKKRPAADSAYEGAKGELMEALAAFASPAFVGQVALDRRWGLRSKFFTCLVESVFDTLELVAAPEKKEAMLVEEQIPVLTTAIRDIRDFFESIADQIKVDTGVEVDTAHVTQVMSAVESVVGAGYLTRPTSFLETMYRQLDKAPNTSGVRLRAMLLRLLKLQGWTGGGAAKAAQGSCVKDPAGTTATKAARSVSPNSGDTDERRPISHVFAQWMSKGSNIPARRRALEQQASAAEELLLSHGVETEEDLARLPANIWEEVCVQLPIGLRHKLSGSKEKVSERTSEPGGQ
mmetsp:Transcript_8198/g.20630  ORF Transcript_8198/g.20630 Transcript_8198/m.20630 type:complete len:1234 (-) Transcript_8198:31-3732(-)